MDDENLRVETSLTVSKPLNIYATPLLFENSLIGVLELASLGEYSKSEIEFFENCSNLFASIIVTSQEAKKLKEALLKNEEQTKEIIKQKSEIEQQNIETEQQAQEIEQQNREIEQQLKEIEEQKLEIEEQLKVVQEQKIELAEQNRYKDEFLSNMSHELRTPLNAIILLSSLLMKRGAKKFDQKELNKLETIKTSGEELLELINNLLDISKISAKQMPITVEEIDLENLIKQSCKVFVEIAENRGINLVVDVQYKTNIVSDSLKIKQILKNLLSNAIKFTEDGKNIKVLVKKAKEPYDVLLEVQDEGIGIPKEKIKKVFEPFKQSDGSTTRKYGGTGLGLALVKEYVSLLQGEIQLESEAGKGAKFIISLPKELDLHRVEDEELLDVVNECKLIDRKCDNKLILIIEDNESHANAISEHLTEKGIDVVVARDGKTGVEYAKELLPYVIILDLNLPGLRGEKVLKELKSDVNTKDIPIKVLSARDYDEKIIKFGAESFFQKPSNIEELENILDKMVSSGSILFVGSDEISKSDILEFIKSSRDDLNLISVKNLKEAYEKLKVEKFKLIIVELNNFTMENLQDFSEFSNEISIIGYSSRELSQDQFKRVKEYIDTVILMTTHSKERLLNEIDRFLNRKKRRVPISLEINDYSLKNRKVLIVDDDERNILALKEVLENVGCSVIKSYNGKEALEKIKSEKFDVIIIDLMMPEMDGYETIKKIRKEFKDFKTPILVLSAKFKREKESSLEVDSYIQKPVNFDTLIDELKKLTR